MGTGEVEGGGGSLPLRRMSLSKLVGSDDRNSLTPWLLLGGGNRWGYIRRSKDALYQLPSAPNLKFKRIQHIKPTNIGWCWSIVLRVFARVVTLRLNRAVSTHLAEIQGKQNKRWCSIILFFIAMINTDFHYISLRSNHKSCFTFSTSPGHLYKGLATPPSPPRKQQIQSSFSSTCPSGGPYQFPRGIVDFKVPLFPMERYPWIKDNFWDYNIAHFIFHPIYWRPIGRAIIANTFCTIRWPRKFK